ncbi:MAG: fumarate hydratase [Candidatus Izemoplasmataceae bacterium]
MRFIDPSIITEAIKDSVIKINYELDDSLISLIQKAKKKERSNIASSILDDIIENSEIAKEGNVPLCQDTGVVVVFAEVGFDVHIDGNIYDAINEGVRQGYSEGYLRKSMVNHPFERVNTKDNTPAMIHLSYVKGDKLTLKIASKGGGSENMSTVKMLTPAAGIDGVKKLVLDTVFQAGGKPCPPIIVGIGLGGNFEKSAIIAKESLLRPLGDKSDDPIIARLEDELYDEINKLGVGPMGVGGDTTCLAVKINYLPMHIASLPVAINIQCHSARHIEVIL